jgi:uncharacterized protein with NAD-binding domain and iron-sulfur cluster
MAETPARKKVAVLGGGMAALTAAYQLSEDGGYDITVYQLGWRLGGQGASGRNLNMAGRIEEHGLHVWFGFYENAFRLMQRCYTELGRPASAPLHSVETAFRPVNSLTMLEEFNGQRTPWIIDFPGNDMKPWETCPAVTLWSSIINILEWMIEFAEGKDTGSPARVRPIPASQPPSLLVRLSNWIRRILERLFPQAAPGTREPKPIPDWVREAFDKYEVDLERDTSFTETWFLRKAHQLVAAMPEDPETQMQEHHVEYHGAITWLIKEFANLLWSRVHSSVETDPKERQEWTLLYLAATMVSGMLADRLLTDGFDPLDKFEMTDWFYAHKLVEDGLANDIAYRSAPMQTFYDLCFHYKNGDTSLPKVAAGVALRTVIRIVFENKGSVLWYMQSAMGDTIFAPIYQVLRNRGVNFEFFSRVVNLGLSADQKALETVKISRQVNLKVGQYDPLVLIKDLPAWPSEPLYDQILEGDQLCSEKVNLEHAWTTWQDTGGELTLQAGNDFDFVILGIGIGALKPLTTELYRASESWCSMIDKIETVQTQAFQLWLKPDSRQLGVQGSRPVVGGYVEPYSSLTDFSDLIPRENWPASADLHSIVYSCGVLQDIPGETQEQADQRVYQIAFDFLLKDSNPLWPKGIRHKDPDELAWHNLVAPDTLKGKDRFQSQYWRANVDPVERYVLSLPDTNQYRLKAGGSGFDRLILTGNWIDTGFNIACIESAVMSGLQAARAVMDKSLTAIL